MDYGSIPAGRVARTGNANQFPAPLEEPATLSRRTSDSATASETIIAQGPLLIMAAGYLALDQAQRHQFHVRRSERDMSPAEIDEIMAEWSNRDRHGDA